MMMRWLSPIPTHTVLYTYTVTHTVLYITMLIQYCQCSYGAGNDPLTIISGQCWSYGGLFLLINEIKHA